MRGDFDEDEYDDEVGGYWDEEEEMCADCQRFGSMMDECSICGAPMCSGCHEMGCGVCRGPHK